MEGVDLLAAFQDEQAGKSQAWRMGAGRFVCEAMSSFDSWLQPLRAYPPGFVLACVAFSVGPIIWLITKVLKWSIYGAGMLLFLGVTGLCALWLWV